eukprot:COSAG02_NODE_22073_length_764_cov_0.981955_1_plen_30_part_10
MPAETLPPRASAEISSVPPVTATFYQRDQL